MNKSLTVMESTLDNKEKKPQIIPLNNDTRQQLKDTLIISERSKIHFIKYDEILYCEASGNYTEIHLIDGKKIVSATCLKLVFKKLESSHFIRVHAKYGVNWNHIKSIEMNDYWQVNIAEMKLPISRSKIKEIKSYLSL